MNIKNAYHSMESIEKSSNLEEVNALLKDWIVDFCFQLQERFSSLDADDFYQIIMEYIWGNKIYFFSLKTENQKKHIKQKVFDEIKKWNLIDENVSKISSKKFEKLAEDCIKNGVQFEKEILQALSEDEKIQEQVLKDGLGESKSLIKDFFDDLSDWQALELLEQCIGKTTKQEQLLLSLYYEQNLTYKQIATIMDLSIARVHQIVTKAISTIRLELYKKSFIS